MPFAGHNFCVLLFFHFYSETQNTQLTQSPFMGTDCLFTFSKDFCWPSTAKGIIGRDLKVAGYVLHYKMWTGNIFGLILKNKMATTGVSSSVMESAYISLIIGLRGLGW